MESTEKRTRVAILKYFIAILTFILLLTACSTPKITKYQSTLDSSSTHVSIVADPQIHNVYGHALKQMWLFSDLVSKVASRPAELNILAPFVLDELTSKSLISTQPDNLAIVLGDGTNIGCSGEYDEFNKTLNKALFEKGNWLMAHGNHDSYMMGTTNGYVISQDIVADKGEEFWPPKIKKNNLPADVSWWNYQKYASGELNWRDSCFRYSEEIDKYSPMNKIRWLSRYLTHLKSSIENIDINTKMVDHDDSDDFNIYVIKTSDDTYIGDRAFSARGRWYEPIYTVRGSNKSRIPDNVYTTKAFESYIVQSVELDAYNRMLIIDTSVCRYARSGIKHPLENAGLDSCI